MASTKPIRCEPPAESDVPVKAVTALGSVEKENIGKEDVEKANDKTINATVEDSGVSVKSAVAEVENALTEAVATGKKRAEEAEADFKKKSQAIDTVDQETDAAPDGEQKEIDDPMPVEPASDSSAAIEPPTTPPAATPPPSHGNAGENGNSEDGSPKPLTQAKNDARPASLAPAKTIIKTRSGSAKKTTPDEI